MSLGNVPATCMQSLPQKLSRREVLFSTFCINAAYMQRSRLLAPNTCKRGSFSDLFNIARYTKHEVYNVHARHTRIKLIFSLMRNPDAKHEPMTSSARDVPLYHIHHTERVRYSAGKLNAALMEWLVLHTAYIFFVHFIGIALK